MRGGRGRRGGKGVERMRDEWERERGKGNL